MRLARLGTCLALALTGCDAGPSARADGGAGCVDCGARDAVADPPLETDELCYDEVDNDGNGAIDCADQSCSTTPVCCIGSARPECCAARTEMRTLSFAGCPDGPAASCATDPSLGWFGPHPPVIENDGLVARGPGYGGVALGGAIDVRAVNVELAADLDVPARDARCSDCADGAGVAVLDALPAPGGPAFVRFGVLAAGARDEVVVLLDDEAVAREPLSEGALSLELALDVEGTAVARAGGVEVARIGGLSLPERAWLAVIGQSSNLPAGIEPLRVTGAQAVTRGCDVPAALARRQSPVVPWSGATGWSPREVRQPSVVVWDHDGTRRSMMAFAHEGRIYLAQRTGFGEFRHELGDPGPPALEPPEGVVSMRDPSLALDGTHLVLYFVGIDEEGRARVWKATGAPGYAQTFGAPAIVLDPAELGIDDVDGIAVARLDEGWTMVARVRTAGRHRIVRFAADEHGLAFDFDGGSLASATLHEPQADDLFAFDRDEVAAPALAVVPDARGNPTVRLFYAGRRGTRWSIGAMAAITRTDFVPLGTVLEPGAGFDALGVTDPAPVVEDGALRLYYAGTDGTSYRIGVAGPTGTLGE